MYIDDNIVNHHCASSWLGVTPRPTSGYRGHMLHIFPVSLSSSPPPIPYFNICMSVFVCQYLTWSVIIHLMSFIVITFWPLDVLVLDAMATAQ